MTEAGAEPLRKKKELDHVHDAYRTLREMAEQLAKMELTDIYSERRQLAHETLRKMVPTAEALGVWFFKSRLHLC